MFTNKLSQIFYNNSNKLSNMQDLGNRMGV